MTADDEKKNRTSGPVQSNSFCVDGVFDMYINCAKEAYEKRELAACKTLGMPSKLATARLARMRLAKFAIRGP